MHIYRCKQITEVAHVYQTLHSGAAMRLLYSEIVRRSTVQSELRMSEARGKAVVTWRGLLGSTKQ